MLASKELGKTLSQIQQFRLRSSVFPILPLFNTPTLDSRDGGLERRKTLCEPKTHSARSSDLNTNNTARPNRGLGFSSSPLRPTYAHP